MNVKYQTFSKFKNRSSRLLFLRQNVTFPSFPKSKMQPLKSQSNEDSMQRGLPESLKDLAINDKGDLVDEKGNIINGFGASRFDVAVRAMRGEFDPLPAEKEYDNERSSGLLTESLVAFPREYTFQIVAKPSQSFDQKQLVKNFRLVIEEVCGKNVQDGNVVVKERMGGKFISVNISQMVDSGSQVNTVIQKLGEVQGVIMKY
eukprot:TRINITY_DN35938_c0_g1_i5.p1 TRINITY_DN35938_c0_g1~~TRINITY_DN35938_c0_g1_i5.p1  ORF type:complete len:203 (-),score=21.25 TRINITY_DN35938_c0_g1_i5:333-941(-)